MGFGKGEYVDYTLLKKKGILKVNENKPYENVKIDDGFVDFGSINNLDNQTGDANQSSSQETQTNNFGFLSDFASIGASNSTNNNFDNVSDENSQLSNPLSNLSDNSSNNLESDFKTLKVNFEDLNYKFERLLEKIDKIEEKLRS